jgi:hypothetical protein
MIWTLTDDKYATFVMNVFPNSHSTHSCRNAHETIKKCPEKMYDDKELNI